jgi:hypothetical protein
MSAPRALRELLAYRHHGTWVSQGRALFRLAVERAVIAHARGLAPRFRTRWVAKQIQITPRYLKMLLSGRRRPSLAVAVRVAVVFGVEATSWGLRPVRSERAVPIRSRRTLAPLERPGTLVEDAATAAK